MKMDVLEHVRTGIALLIFALFLATIIITGEIRAYRKLTKQLLKTLQHRTLSAEDHSEDVQPVATLGIHSATGKTSEHADEELARTSR